MRGIPRLPEAEGELSKAQRLAWVSIAYNLSTLAMLYMVMSGSQALKTELVEDAMSIFPPVLFLVGDKIARREPSRRYPFGYERAVSAGYLGSALALLAVGFLLLFDGGMKLAMQEHPTIGGFPMFGYVLWTGWLALPALLWCAIPAHFLGTAKRRAAETLHDKTLAADAEMNEANWQSAAAAILGIMGVGFGLWWADAAAGVLISLEIIRSGWSELKTALGDIMDGRPVKLTSKETDSVPDHLTEFLKRQPWIDDVIVRVRERGRELTAEAHVVPKSDTVSVEEVSSTGALACQIDPRITEVTIAPVKEMPEDVAKSRAAESA